MIHRVFHEAKENAPSIIFIDDSDVIFESGQEHGLYRYLLTMLDGLESKSAARVCVMMTAMDVGNLPPALVRSGRVELWLEMRLPDEEARLSILQQLVAALPPPLRLRDLTDLVDATKGFTGADLKRVIEDGKALYAFDRATGQSLKPVAEYFLDSVETVRDNKARYNEAEARARANRPPRPPWFDVFHGAIAYASDGED
jgi:SpoVK/Ycf46/Vps4 family AAA+-type ATPase